MHTSVHVLATAEQTDPVGRSAVDSQSTVVRNSPQIDPVLSEVSSQIRHGEQSASTAQSLAHVPFSRQISPSEQLLHTAPLPSKVPHESGPHVGEHGTFGPLNPRLAASVVPVPTTAAPAATRSPTSRFKTSRRFCLRANDFVTLSKRFPSIMVTTSFYHPCRVRQRWCFSLRVQSRSIVTPSPSKAPGSHTLSQSRTSWRQLPAQSSPAIQRGGWAFLPLA